MRSELHTRPRIAYFSPLPPQHTGVADYSAELLPSLAEHFTITLFHQQPEAVDPALARQFRLERAGDYPRQRWEHDLALYHLGNNRFHEWIYDAALRYPGASVLHDYYLHPYLADRAVREASFAGYGRELAYNRGMGGVTLSWQVRNGERPRPDYAFPLVDRLLDLSLGVIVHNETVAADIRSRRPGLNLRVIPHFVRRYDARSRRAELGWPEDAVILAHAGYITPNRQLELALRAFARLRSALPQARFLIVGEVVNNEVDLPGLIADLGLGESVHVAGFASDVPALLDWIATTDILVNLRHPTMGETSGVTLRALALGKPVIMFDEGWYGELPADVCRRTPALDEEALLIAMRDLAASAELRAQIGRKAVEYVEQHLGANAVAGSYADFLASCLRLTA
jgi:glycosyltransferase involved in cell wall biosynthesis